MQQHNEAYRRVIEKQRRRVRIRQAIADGLAIAVTIAGFILILFFCEGQDSQEAKAKATVKQPIITAGVATDFVGVTSLPAEYTESATQSMELSESDAYLLARIAMAEAEGEDTIGKALVIRTILNRVESDYTYFPDTVSEVIFQKDAFTPTRNGRFEKVEPNEDCYAALELIEEGWDESQGALYFERNTTKETWHTENLEKLFVHGNHTFYTEVAAE